MYQHDIEAVLHIRLSERIEQFIVKSAYQLAVKSDPQKG
jgi:hypothetical protein